eukprot:COSAG04_NODE_7311_length_1149_cov_1.311429_1_plen_128_part_01
MLPCAQSAAGIVAPQAVATAEAESAAINDSYAILASPLRRAEHLLELHGGGLQEGDGADPGAQIGFCQESLGFFRALACCPGGCCVPVERALPPLFPCLPPSAAAASTALNPEPLPQLSILSQPSDRL